MGAFVVIVLGAARAAVQVVAQRRYDIALGISAVLVTATALWAVVPSYVDWAIGKTGWRRGALLLAGLAAMLVLEPIWFLWTLRTLGGWRPPGGALINGILRTDTNLLLFGAITAVLWTSELERRRYRVASLAERLRRRTADVELDVLTMQLQPHFLFNTLNLVSQLAYESAERARRAIANLRGLLNESTRPLGRCAASLEDELRLLDAYLGIQRERFGTKLDVRVSVDVTLLRASVPRMLLQPIVENAIRHGISRRARGGRIRITAAPRPGGRMELSVIDDGVGLTAPAREGMGLSNARHRLEQMFGTETSVVLQAETAGGASTRIEMPVLPFDAGDETPAADEPSIDVGPGRHELGLAPTAAIVVLAWLCVGAIWAEAESVVPIALGKPVPWRELLGRNMLNAVVWIALTPVVLGLARRWSILGRARRITQHAAAGMLVTGVHLLVTTILVRIVLQASAATVRSLVFGWVVWDVIAYVTIAALAENRIRGRALRREAEEALASERRLAHARLALLRVQLQPTLLASGLDAIERSVDDPVRCESVTTRFGDVLRALLASVGRAEMPLRDEIALLDAYLATIGGRIGATMIDDGLGDVLIPAVLLQPIAAAMRAIQLTISAAPRGDRMTIEMGAHEGELIDTRALESIERRLRETPDLDASIRLARRDDIVTVRIDLPVSMSSIVTIGPATVSAIA